MKSRGQRDVGPRRADALDQAAIIVGGVLAVHRLQHRIGSRLHRQMQIGHQLGIVAMGGDQVIGHVAGMAGGVADAVDAFDLRQRVAQLRQASSRLPS